MKGAVAPGTPVRLIFCLINRIALDRFHVNGPGRGGKRRCEALGPQSSRSRAGMAGDRPVSGDTILIWTSGATVQGFPVLETIDMALWGKDM